jgi:hypothetical protein
MPVHAGGGAYKFTLKLDPQGLKLQGLNGLNPSDIP